MSSTSPLNEEQQLAVNRAWESGLSVVYGMPGSGKTTVAKSIVIKWRTDDPNTRVLVLSFTARAVARCARVVGTHLKGVVYTTLHMLKSSQAIIAMSPFPNVLVDECSMVSCELLSDLFQCLLPKRLVLMGDGEQLPPVQALPLFDTLCTYPLFLKTKLEKVYRQKDGSALLANINMVRTGKNLTLKHFKQDEGFGLVDMPKFDAHSIAPWIKKVVEERAESGLLDDLPQFLALTLETVDFVNSVVQTERQRTNSSALIPLSAGQKLYVGDVVVCTQNFFPRSKKKELPLVSNGTIGIVRKNCIEYTDANYEDPYPFETSYKLAFCITVHGAQGAEYDNVVFFFDDERMGSVEKSLLLVGMSRARKCLLLLARDKGLKEATKNRPKKPASLRRDLERFLVTKDLCDAYDELNAPAPMDKEEESSDDDTPENAPAQIGDDAPDPCGQPDRREAPTRHAEP
jgi:exodeoxyribonuclease V alpha subunit